MREYMDEVIKLVDLSQNRPLNDLVYEGLRKAIILGIIPVGEHINEKAYADYMNISRTPMRKAIEKLRDEDILEYIPNFGVVVKKVTVSDAEEIYKIRIALDTLAAVTAMDLLSDEDCVRMQELLDMTNAANDRHEVAQVIEYFSQFNALIYQFARMPRLRVVVRQLQEYLARFRDISLLDDVRRTEALREHEYIFECLKTKDRELVARIISEHLSASKNFVIKEILRFEKEMEESIE